ncbi:MAG: hypothetical protein NC311_08180 [Muribaculaceae bacterium]|nr:hypothetical protein [Muribaculaceae bacterium]MCM1439323.1 hypothetical protein [Roseburia sp.]
MKNGIKVIREGGLAALCGHIKAIKATAEQYGSAVAALAQSTAASLEEVDGLLDGKAEKAAAVEVTIPASGWKQGSGNASYPYYYDIAEAGATAKDRADVTISPESVGVAVDCGLCPTTETLQGAIRVRSAVKPTADLTAEYWMHQGKE